MSENFLYKNIRSVFAVKIKAISGLALRLVMSIQFIGSFSFEAFHRGIDTLRNVQCFQYGLFE